MHPGKDQKGLIWTNHIIERLQGRRIPQDWVWKTYQFADTTVNGKEPQTKELQKRIEERTVTLIIKKNDRNEWLLLSAWVEPPFPNSIDARKTWSRSDRRTPALFRFLKWIGTSLFPKK